MSDPHTHNTLGEISRDLKKIVELLTPKEPRKFTDEEKESMSKIHLLHKDDTKSKLYEKLEAFAKAKRPAVFDLASAYVKVEEPKPAKSFTLKEVPTPPGHVPYLEPIKLTDSDLHPWTTFPGRSPKPSVSVVWQRGKKVEKFIKKIEALGLTDTVKADALESFYSAVEDECVSRHEAYFYDSDFK